MVIEYIILTAIAIEVIGFIGVAIALKFELVDGMSMPQMNRRRK